MHPPLVGKVAPLFRPQIPLDIGPRNFKCYGRTFITQVAASDAASSPSSSALLTQPHVSGMHGVCTHGMQFGRGE